MGAGLCETMFGRGIDDEPVNRTRHGCFILRMGYLITTSA